MTSFAYAITSFAYMIEPDMLAFLWYIIQVHYDWNPFSNMMCISPTPTKSSNTCLCICKMRASSVLKQWLVKLLIGGRSN